MEGRAEAATAPITGHCYCGAVAVRAMRAPEVVAWCHCDDCRRVTGAPAAAFAGFAEGHLSFEPDEGRAAPGAPGVRRSFCAECGSPLASRFDYLPGQVYVPLGILDQAGEMEPQLHSYDSRRLPWLHIEDNAERLETSSRKRLAGGSAGGEESGRMRR
ncbi:GFA family protein [Afifella sp. IM 167]|uniref:GFA family protein n=1 Tax=Afifella sp. IM 167 TaxID=2033586 RepID=UPI001CCBEDDF|nr:GFA family protein [Afifella sp. IM 167]MBZ8132276.1 aldehyde-activating protein [Afifella sp. IM 167]